MEFNRRVEHLHAVTGLNFGAIAGALDVSRTMLHYYRRGIHPPDAGILLRLARAEEKAGIESTRGLRGSPPEGADGEAGDRQIQWLRGLLEQQRETVLTAQRHLRQIEGWLADAGASPWCELDLDEIPEDFSAGPSRDSRRTQRGMRPGGAGGAELLRDIDTVSLPIFGHLPAGWPQNRDGVAAQRAPRTVPVAKGRFPDGAFGLEVRGESMNAATPRPILDGDIVVLLPPDQREPRHGDIVAALVDGETCLKRLVAKRRPAHLCSESTNRAFKEIYPAHDLVIQGVLVGKL